MQSIAILGSISASFILAFVVASIMGGIMSIPLPPSEKRASSIDGLRGFLALAVLCHHFPILRDARITGIVEPPTSVPLANLGPSAVAIFFMITAFLFYGKLMREKGRVDFFALYVGRVFRLVPMYLVIVGFLVLISFNHASYDLLTSVETLSLSLINWLAFTLLSAPPINDFPYSGQVAGIVWSLRYEWIFYASLPLVAVAVRLVPAVSVRILTITGVAIAVGIARDHATHGISTKIGVPFVLGMLAVEVLQNPRLKSLLTRREATLLPIFAVIFAIAYPEAPYSFVRMIALFLVFTPIAAGNTCFGLMIARPCRLLGEATYSFYLLHCLVLYLFFCAIGDSTVWGYGIWVGLPVLAAIISAVSMLSYFYIERPFMALGASLLANRRISVTPAALSS